MTSFKNETLSALVKKLSHPNARLGRLYIDKFSIKVSMHLSWETVWYFGWPLSFRKLKGFLTSLWACGATFISTKVGVYLLEIIWEHQIVIALFMISLLYDAGNEKWKVLLLYSKGFKITKISGTIYHTSQLRQWQDHNLKQTKVGTSMFTKPRREWRISQCLKITSKLYWRNFIIFFRSQQH